MKIYVAGPYGAGANEVIRSNVWYATMIGRALVRKGHNPFVPHLYHFVQLGLSECLDKVATEDEWLAMSVDWMLSCDGVLMVEGWRESKGATKEHDVALKCGLKVYYSIEDIPDG